MGNKKFLVIENEKTWKEKIEGALSDDFDSVEVPEDFVRQCSKGFSNKVLGATLTKILKDNYYDLRAIICDLGLKNSDYTTGVSVIRWIRNCGKETGLPEEYLLGIPIIACTASTDRKDHLSAIAQGADCVITKNDDEVEFNDTLVGNVKPRIERFNRKCESILFFDYKIGISYTHRNKNKEHSHQEFVNEIAQLLKKQYTDGKVFYDKDGQENGMTPETSQEQFCKHYENDCEYILVCISSDYNDDGEDGDSWTNREWKSIKNVFEKDIRRVIFLPIESVDVHEAFGILGIKSTETIMRPNANDLREKYYEVIEGRGTDQKDIWNKIVADKKGSPITIKDYVGASFHEKDRIVRNIHDTIIKPIVEKIDSNQLWH